MIGAVGTWFTRTEILVHDSLPLRWHTVFPFLARFWPLRDLKRSRCPTILAWEEGCFPPNLDSGGENSTMAENLERLKQRVPLLEYLQRHNWKPCRTGSRQEFVGLCPLHQETHPSFYVNAAKNLFYCHGCGRGGDLIRFVQPLSSRSALPPNGGSSRTGTAPRARFPIAGGDGRFLSASTAPPSRSYRLSGTSRSTRSLSD